MQNSKHRLRKLESTLKRVKASWYLTDGVTQVSAYADELWGCFTATMRRCPHPLLESVLRADVKTFDGGSTVLSLIQKLRTREVNKTWTGKEGSQILKRALWETG